MLKILLAVAVTSLGVGTRCAQASSVLFGDTANSTSMLGNFSGSLDYSLSSPSTATLTVDLTNTSPLANGGFLTAFAFNNPFDKISGVTLATAPAGPPASNFGVIGGSGGDDFKDDISGSPFGNFDIGASITSSLLGGGSPNGGLAVGQTGTFTFSLTGTTLSALTSQFFINALSSNPQGGGAKSFIVRFRGFDNGGSDKVPGSFGSDTAVPEPASMVLFGIGVVFCSACAVRRRQRKPAA